MIIKIRKTEQLLMVVEYSLKQWSEDILGIKRIHGTIHPRVFQLSWYKQLMRCSR